MTHSHSRDSITDLNVQLTKISHPYQCRKSLLSYGIWDSSMNMIEIVHQHRSAAKSFLFMGITKNSKLYLYPEEAIFLIQCSLLQVVRNENRQIPISLDEIYSMCLNQVSFQLEHLHVYQYLTRIGFILLRHQSSSTRTDEEKVLLIVSVRNKCKRKRKRDESERELTETTSESMEKQQYTCPIHSSADCQRQWFPSYTDEPPIDIRQYPRLIFPDQFAPVHIDWIPAEFNEKVSRVKLLIYENRVSRPRPSYSLIRPEDLQSHSHIYERLTSFSPRLKPPNPTKSSVFFDVYTPRKHFRKSQPGPPDYFVEIKRANDEFSFENIYNEQQSNKLTALVHNGDISFYKFKSFDLLAALQSK